MPESVYKSRGFAIAAGQHLGARMLELDHAPSD
jgi:hypothetical protein